jgi:hypothetical protein
MVSVASVGQAQSIVGQYVAREARGIVELVIEQADETLNGYLSDPQTGATIPLKGTRVTDTHWQGYMQTEQQQVQFELLIVEEGLHVQISEVENLIGRVFYPLNDNDVFNPTTSLASQNPLLLELLAYIPDTSEVRERYDLISYSHLWRISQQAVPGYNPYVVQIQENVEAIGLDFTDYRFIRVMFSSFLQGDMSNFYEGMPAAVGFSFFEIEAGLTVGSDNKIVVFKTEVDTDNVTKVLTSRGFTERVIDNIPVWERFEDDTTTLNARNRDDPFGGSIGFSARIALFTEFIVNSTNTPTTAQSIAAANDKYPSLADAEDIQALVYSTSTLGEVTQAMFLGPHDTSVSFTNESIVTSEITKDDLGVLPTYELSLLADFADADNKVQHAWALLYTSEEEAEIATEEVKQRLEHFSSIIHGANQFERLRFESQVIRHQNFYVSLISANYQLSSFRDYDNWLFRYWIISLYHNDFFPAYVDVP